MKNCRRINSLKSWWRYQLSVWRRRFNISPRAKQLSDIVNYLSISDTLASSGQPARNQFDLIQQAGYTTVINLALATADNAVKDETEIWAELGIDYIHIPVDFENPTDADFEQFVKTMQALHNSKVWLHCAANMRASAFIYRYRTQVLGEDIAQAKQDLDKIWQPVGVWKQFIAQP